MALSFGHPAQPHDPVAGCSGHVSAKSSQPFIYLVWREDRWERGSPSSRVIDAWHRKLHCSGPANRRAMVKKWKRARHRFYEYRHQRLRCQGGPVFAGRVSTFGPPGEGAGTTASGVSSAEPGIALYNQATLGSWFRVTIGGRSATLRQTDIGPAPWTGRTIDVTGAGTAQLGGVVTDSWGTARLLPSGCA